MLSFFFSKDNGKLEAYLQKIVDDQIFDILDHYGAMGVEALRAATPVDTSKTANSWAYRKVKTDTGYALEFYNSNVNNYVNIAIILQYGHGTGTGGYVAGRDYINPAVKPVFDEIAQALTKDISS